MRPIDGKTLRTPCLPPKGQQQTGSNYRKKRKEKEKKKKGMTKCHIHNQSLKKAVNRSTHS
ncbi:hypothetical protein SFRURICE_006827 [Spodoptera frugiperda]|uniref:SFRICE_013139 n=1 Tax=Spodoptera frugiperda TaxID=7108 RepID=A0A2H1WDN7_SPOFR|nr:hypothetical protein SFRURICE_006827 [Spodoptera frugiperda]